MLAPLSRHQSRTDMATVRRMAPEAGATAIVVQALGQNIRYTLDGSDPGPTKGFTLMVGDAPQVIELGPGMILRFIEEAPTATLQYQWVMVQK